MVTDTSDKHTPLNESALAQVVQRINSQYRLMRAQMLTGGVSAQVFALEIMLPEGQTRKMLLRGYGEAVSTRNLSTADEFKLLEVLHAAGLPVPKPYCLDLSAEILPIPFFVLDYTEGVTEFLPANLPDFIHQSAAALIEIQRRIRPDPALSFLPDQMARCIQKLGSRPAVLDDSLAEGRIRDTLAAAFPWPQTNTPALLHGDFWPGNLLWREGRLVAVIDWEDAAWGDPLADVANTRLEMLWAFGIDAMQDFTQQVQAQMTGVDFAALPYWDLYAALRPAHQITTWAAGWPAFGRDDVTEKTMREAHRWFITQAFGRL